MISAPPRDSWFTREKDTFRQPYQERNSGVSDSHHRVKTERVRFGQLHCEAVLNRHTWYFSG